MHFIEYYTLLKRYMLRDKKPMNIGLVGIILQEKLILT